jgi:hypothetical protein
MRSPITRRLVFLLAFALLFEFDPLPLMLGGSLTTTQAEARIGRPATPLSYAGVARRTTRRVVRRTARYYAVLPVGCASTYVYGTSVYSCGGVYYQPYGSRYVVVVFD